MKSSAPGDVPKPRFQLEVLAWIFAGAVILVGLAYLIRPYVKTAEKNARLVTASRTLTALRQALGIYYLQHNQMPLDGTRGVEDTGTKAGFALSEDGRLLRPENTTLGDLLHASGNLGEIRFPYGNGSGLQIRSLAAQDLMERWQTKNLFRSWTGAATVAVLVVPGLSESEAIELQHLVDPIPVPGKELEGDCRILPGRIPGTYSAYIFLFAD